MKFTSLFFDFDGVLADSVEVKTEAFSKLYQKYGPEIQAKVVEHHRNNGGMTRIDKFKFYQRKFLNQPLNEKELKRLCKTFSNLVVEKVIVSPEIVGAEDYLKKIHKMVNCFVVSATPDEEIKIIVKKRGLDKYFLEVLGSSRNKTENIKYLIDKYNLNPDQCAFLGDAESDYKAARECNISFLGILPGADAPLLKIASDIKWIKDFTSLNKEGFHEYQYTKIITTG